MLDRLKFLQTVHISRHEATNRPVATATLIRKYSIGTNHADRYQHHGRYSSCRSPARRAG